MKNVRKLLLVVIAYALLISSVATAYGWFMLRPLTEALDLNVRSSELFGSRLVGRLTSGTTNNQIIDYNSASSYSRDDLAFVLSRAQVNESNFNFKVDVNIDAYQNIKVRFKTVEMWINTNNQIVTNPNIFNYTYGPDIVAGTSEPGVDYMHGTAVLKDISKTVNYITSLTKKTGMTVAASIKEVRIVVISSAVQLNRVDIWNSQVTQVKNLTISGASNTNYKVNVDFTAVSNEMYKRGLAIEFINGSYNAGYFWHTRNFPTNRVIMLNPGTYQIKINSVNHLLFNIVQSGTNINIKVTYDPSYLDSTWGYEDTIYGPNTISIYNQQNLGGYKKGDIVYYEDTNGTNTGYYIAIRDMTGWVQPITQTQYWRKMSIYYQGGQYNTGDVIFYEGYFWIALTDTQTKPPSWGAWQILDRAHVNGNTYQLGSIVYVKDTTGEKTYYYASVNTSLTNKPADSNGWRMISDQYETINKGDSNIRAGEIVYYKGNYYRAVIDGWKHALPGASSSVWQPLTFTPYVSTQGYAKDATVSYGGKLYYARAAILANQVPGVSGAWQELTNQWVAHNVYSNSLIKSFIRDGEKLYEWRGANGTNSLTAPGTERNNWHELTSVWVPTNIYRKNEYVVYDGSFWQLLVDVYPNDNTSVPGIDFNVWKEYQINWDPNRN